MIKGFWKKLPRPFFALAPMADVTDPAFRRIIARAGKPDVMWTEFVSCAGLCSDKGRAVLLYDLAFSEKERPIVAQLFGSDVAQMEESVRLVRSLGFDGVDINMGCPDRAIEKQGAGAALMKNPKLAKALIEAAKRGAGTMPVSVKTRLGYSTNILKSWLPVLLEAGPSAITIHARTRKELSNVPAQWDALREAVSITHRFDSSKKRPLIIGNGDVKDIEEARHKAEEFGVDGIMLGRAIFGNPWLFAKRASLRTPSIEKRLTMMVQHAKMYERLNKAKKPFAVMKKHFKAYVNGFDGAKELRVVLMGTNSSKEVEREVKGIY
jgi:nifR3 family TIM-barrel protein